jgi:DNA (cytosine-5)-methyltransferase 1
MSRPKLLDLFCCEGGASTGYSRAGFDVYGVDLFGDSVQKRYPFPSYKGDATEIMDRLLNGKRLLFRYSLDLLGLSDFAAITGSPPCQAYSITKHTHSNKHPELIEPTRDAMVASGLPYVIENVVGAPLIDPLMLCGSMFNLTAIDTDGTPLRLERHRLFESNLPLVAPKADFHDKTIDVAGAYGGGSSDRRHAKEVRRGGYTPAKEVRAALLGIDWMTLHGMSQSIPPAYTEWLGAQLLAHIESERAA